MTLRFVNHACIEVDFGEGTLVTDPWFSGRVFNDSWELIVEGGDIDFDRLLYIWISHEHPDHLHFPTLRAIRDRTSHPITVLFRRQKDKNVAKAIVAMGFELVELGSSSRLILSPRLAVTCYTNRSDSALLIEANGQRIFNQNDCRLSLSTLRSIKDIDVWLFQFSLAGYSGNDGDDVALSRAGTAHLDMITNYARSLQPRLYIPFASFVRFCHPRNAFLNRWRVAPKVVGRLALPCPVRVLRAGDRSDGQDSTEWWQVLFAQNVAAAPMAKLTDAALVKIGCRFAKSIARAWPRWSVPDTFSISLGSAGRFAILDLRTGDFSMGAAPAGPVVADVDEQSLGFLLRFPWGADTIHISCVATIRDDRRWRWLLYIKHAEYKLAGLGRLRVLVPLPLSWIRAKNARRSIS